MGMNDTPDLGADGPAALARPTEHATYRGKITARTVADGILEQLLAGGHIDARQYAAGCRLRFAYANSWPSGRVSAFIGYVSDPGLDEEDDRDLSEEQRYARQRERYRTWTEALQYLGELRHVTLGLCGGPVVRRGAQYGMIGLTRLADWWKL